jgi:hypothetical protein
VCVEVHAERDREEVSAEEGGEGECAPVLGEVGYGEGWG